MCFCSVLFTTLHVHCLCTYVKSPLKLGFFPSSGVFGLPNAVFCGVIDVVSVHGIQCLLTDVVFLFLVQCHRPADITRNCNQYHQRISRID